MSTQAVHRRANSNKPTNGSFQLQQLYINQQNHESTNIDPGQGEISGIQNYFKTSGEGSLPPIMNRRSTVTHDLRMQKRSRYQQQLQLLNNNTKDNISMSNRRFENAVKTRKSLPSMYPGLSSHAVNILEQTNTSSQYHTTAASSSISRSKQQLYREKMNKEANQLAKIKLSQLRQHLHEGGTSNHHISADQTYSEQLLLEQEILDGINNDDIPTKKERKKTYFTNVSSLQEKQKRQWMIKHGKGHFLDFHDDQIRKLRECFNSLDTDGSGAIGVEELEDPLIGLGFAETRQEVLDMIASVDEDKSNQIEFDEFLTIIKGSNTNDKTIKINKFFKDMTTGKLAQQDISFNMFVQKMRRGYLKNAIFGHDDPSEKEMGIKILKNIAKQFQSQSLSRPETFTNSFGVPITTTPKQFTGMF